MKDKKLVEMALKKAESLQDTWNITQFWIIEQDLKRVGKLQEAQRGYCQSYLYR